MNNAFAQFPSVQVRFFVVEICPTFSLFLLIRSLNVRDCAGYSASHIGLDPENFLANSEFKCDGITFAGSKLSIV